MYKIVVEINNDHGHGIIKAGERTHKTLYEAKEEYKELCTMFNKKGYTVILEMNRGNGLIEITRHEGGKKD